MTTRTDRIVLDGPTDPGTYGPRLLAPSGSASEAALRDRATWTARHHTSDPRTIYPNATSLRRHLTGARLLTLADANVHGVYASYVDAAVNAYLGTGHLPTSDLVCQNER